MTVRVSPFVCALRQADCAALDRRLPVGAVYTPKQVSSVPRLVRVRDDKPRGPIPMKITGRMYDLDDSEEDAIDATPDFMKHEDPEVDAPEVDAAAADAAADTPDGEDKQ